ncbi:MAG: hypothetical protein Pg6A_09250 [Termitinemataceae bacterium]|nr:MAG: hypothetical protein Pg6A_09250 [Termitinemataceae bacterium]
MKHGAKTRYKSWPFWGHLQAEPGVGNAGGRAFARALSPTIGLRRRPMEAKKSATSAFGVERYAANKATPCQAARALDMTGILKSENL